jgi:hypothetical protein
MSRTTLAVMAAIAALIGLIIYAMQGLSAATCEVCVEYNGRTECRTAKGPSVAEATRTAQDNACGLLASGMTESMKCGRTPPKSVKCQ